MESSEVRRKYLDFFKAPPRNHVEIPSAPLIPENDPTTLFTSSGMQPLVPYLLGQPHPAGKRLVNSQKSFRAQDIDEVGDTSHTTFFEMLGNWSLGDYFKKEQLPWIWEFLTEELGLSKEKLFISIFEGTKDVPRDEESARIWKSLGVTEDRMFYYGVEKNWWSRSGEPDFMPPGELGGPDSEVFFDFGQELGLHENSLFKSKKCHPNCQCGRFLEIANSVFMQYQKQKDGSLAELTQKSVDFGGGLERLTAAVNEDIDIFKTDLFVSIIKTIETTTGNSYKSFPEPMRIIADHLRAATFIMNEGVIPSKEKQGYVLRRLIRSAYDQIPGKFDPANDTTTITSSEKRNVFESVIKEIIERYKNEYGYEHLLEKQTEIMNLINTELDSYQRTISTTTTTLPPSRTISGKEAFKLHSTHGLSPKQLRASGYEFNQEEYDREFKKHQELSRTASAGMFKGGLADQNEETTRLHTATHLLHQALRTVLGNHVSQKGSNITAERLRFDFSHPTKLSDDQKQKVEDLVNEKIQENLPVSFTIMDKNEAFRSGALAYFGERYGDKVKVYSIGPMTGSGSPFSREICGGPHVRFTAELGRFTITKEESAGSGIRRIYATIAPYEVVRSVRKPSSPKN